MATFTKIPLSGSTNGKGIKIVQTATLGDTLHTAPAGTTSIDELELFITNNHTIPVTLTIEWGTATVAEGNIVLPIPSKNGLTYIVPSLLIQNSLVITAFASVTNVLLVFGSVKRLTY
jgi:hypothetical protein